ncbi:ParE-like toxin of type II ParDE toxin-antitoxin system [Aquimarina sp. MAR_2010_214]|uniref:type II toxin-antitoxin system RelE/ParE family toxin n=1 Tax=Aquimarina sp. MAR_2010_214 TaxID=1250026 RepID=UPI000C70DFF6|nr:type II toxin-antitoxin system RelE/ParE family toxin [Aquimarina sp. MAR_2010_214]PKV50817.1 ParE-like toxin of type II ParDE toxin-antitoxin system [Aquimarina sp. MAR_2010_214]
MYQFTISEGAKAHIGIAQSWYHSIAPNLSKRFLIRFRQTIQLLTEYPEIKPVAYDNVHCAGVNDFPYTIHYVIDRKQKHINVIGVFHTAAHPDNWKP